MEIKLTRGDTRIYTFSILTDDGADYVLSDQDKLYFTVKRSWFDSGCILQKTFGNGITYNAATREYELELTHNCTCDIECRDYVFDIQLMVGSETPAIVNTLCKGTLVLDVEAPHKGNEI